MAVTVERIKIRAEIIFNGISVVTPNIMSFNVRKARGQSSASFSASLKIPHDQLNSSSVGRTANVVIRAGEEGQLKTIFTGYVYKMSLNPSRTDSSYAIVNVSGKDVLSTMEGQNVTRRVPAQQLAKWGSITSLLVKRDKFKERFPLKIRDDQPRLTWDQIQDFSNFVVGSPDPTAAGINAAGSTGTAGRMDITDVSPLAE